ncbi:MAG: outer membrane protein TolC [Myxococcota bacterium]|jgi:outer membrane protein TolC
MLFWLMLSAALAEPLPLSELLDSVDTHLPALRAAEAKIAAAEAKLLAARGAFDPTLTGKASSYTGSDPRLLSTLSVGSETLFGPRWSAGVRRSEGTLKPYETELETGAEGEWFARAEVPLGSLILPDSRAALLTAGLDTEIARRMQADKRLELRYKAAAAYWKWAGSGAKLSVEQSLLALAESRLGALRRQVEEGSAPRMDLLDAQRAQLERQARVVAARADLDISGRLLALYYRSDDGEPLRPTAEQLPPLDAPGGLQPLDELVSRAQQRPDLLALDAALQAAQIELRRSQLDLVPDATIVGQVAEDTALGKTEWLLGAELKVPLLLRKDRGSLGAARAEVDRLAAERRWLSDQIAADIEASWIAAEAARQQAALIAETAAQASELLSMEQIRYDIGDSDLFKLILREDKLAEMRKYLAAAQVDAQLRQAALLRAVGGG